MQFPLLYSYMQNTYPRVFCVNMRQRILIRSTDFACERKSREITPTCSLRARFEERKCGRHIGLNTRNFPASDYYSLLFFLPLFIQSQRDKNLSVKRESSRELRAARVCCDFCHLCSRLKLYDEEMPKVPAVVPFAPEFSSDTRVPRTSCKFAAEFV